MDTYSGMDRTCGRGMAAAQKEKQMERSDTVTDCGWESRGKYSLISGIPDFPRNGQAGGEK